MKRFFFLGILAGMGLTCFSQGRISIQLGNLSKVVNEENGVALFCPEAHVRFILYDQEIMNFKITKEIPPVGMPDAIQRKTGGKLNKVSESQRETIYSTGKLCLTVNKMPIKHRLMDALGQMNAVADPGHKVERVIWEPKPVQKGITALPGATLGGSAINSLHGLRSGKNMN
ncbi:MAG: hypothetical protein PHY99_10720 [Bacteroidales bacterium]|nr:hypothetical protein [Bacteroidales bacterium]